MLQGASCSDHDQSCGLGWHLSKQEHQQVWGHFSPPSLVHLEHGLKHAQRGLAVLALDAHVHERGVRVHIALHSARAHLLHQTQCALERALAVLAAALHDKLQGSELTNAGLYVCTSRQARARKPEPYR